MTPESLIQPQYTEIPRLTALLTTREAQNARVEAENEALDAENTRLVSEVDRLNRELLQTKFDAKCAGQHQRFREVQQAITTQGDDLMHGYSDGLTA